MVKSAHLRAGVLPTALTSTTSNASASTQIGKISHCLVAACVMYDAAKLPSVDLVLAATSPEHCGMSLSTSPHGLRRLWSYPAGVYHQELLQQLLTAAWLQTTHSVGVLQRVLIPGIRATWGIRIAVNCGVLGVCGTGLPNQLNKQTQPAQLLLSFLVSWKG